MLDALNMTLDKAIAFNQKQNVINHPRNLKTAQITDYITDDYISAFSHSRPRI